MDKALYVAYLTGAAGQTMALIYIGGGIIAGIDVGTMQYDGSYAVRPDGSLEGTVEYVTPSGTTLITGVGLSTPTKVPMRLHLPASFADGRVITFETPFGKVNARFEKLKDLP
jgi:hypothetical protein